VSGEGGGERRWLRPLGLFGLVLALAVGQPLVLVGIPFALLAFLAPGDRLVGLLVGAVIIAFVFAGAPGEGLWYLERGWAVVLGGWFLAVTLAWPQLPFFPRSLVALGGTLAWCGTVLVGIGGWGRVRELVRARIEQGAASTLELFGMAGGNEGPSSAFAETLARTAAIQEALFPALLALASLAALGVAWWLHVRFGAGSGGALQPLRTFRFADPLIWVLIAGVALLVSSSWTEGWGLLGANLVAFMAGLYALRGAAVLLHRTGRVTVPGALLVGVAALVAPPLVLAGAMVVGVGDSWFDLRARGAARDDLGPD
jgi:hypothetical protein